MTTDLKTSLLINRQVPEFIRDEYPTFIAFLEAYYEFLEQKQGTEINDLITQAKALRTVTDVDESISQFQTNFINNYAPLIPQNTTVDKAFLIKNILPFYLTKGSIKSFELLFRLLYGEEVTITFPKDNILRASDGKWTVENVVRIDNEVYSYFVGNGTKKEFILAQQVDVSDISVYVNNVLTTSGFYIQKEIKKITFDIPPANNAEIKIVYDDFNETLFTNRKITGLTSGATAIVERAAPRLITQQTSIELYIDESTLVGSFLNAEVITADIFADDGETLLTIRSDTAARLSSITVTNGGANYNIGDPVTIIGGASQNSAEAIISEVSIGFADAANVNYGGAGFEIGGIVTAFNDSGTVILATGSIDSSGINSPNTYTLFTDTINPYSNIVLSNTDYGFPSAVIPTGENIATRLVDAFSKFTITDIGPMINVTIIYSGTDTSNLSIISDGAKYANTIDIKSFRSIGRIDIVSGGSNYRIGDEVVLGPNPTGTYGRGFAAAVTNTNASGAITNIEIQPSRISGTANTTAGNNVVVGDGTNFTGELAIGDRIMINSEVRYVDSILLPTLLNVNVAFTRTSTQRKVGAYDRYAIGGQGYIQNNFPTVSVSSTTGSSANLQITSLMGDGERLGITSSGVSGSVTKIKVTDPGVGYQFIPTIDLSNRGNGTATAEAQIERSYVSFPGKWVGSDGIISSLDRKIEGLDYYIDFTYVTSVATEFSKYVNILKELLHPAGFKNYAEYPLSRPMDLNLTVGSSVTETISGIVSTNANSIVVTGTSTKFNVANSLGIISIGTQIAINNEIRTINAIVSNTSLTVSSAFTTNTSAQTLIIIT
jgi:hypothetical protein